MSRTVRADGEKLAPAEGNQALENNVISADLHSLGQLRPRDEIRFESVDWDAARALPARARATAHISRLACALARDISCLTIHSYPETIVSVENYAPTSSGRFCFWPASG